MLCEFTSRFLFFRKQFFVFWAKVGYLYGDLIPKPFEVIRVCASANVKMEGSKTQLELSIKSLPYIIFHRGWGEKPGECEEGEEEGGDHIYVVCHCVFVWIGLGLGLKSQLSLIWWMKMGDEYLKTRRKLLEGSGPVLLHFTFFITFHDGFICLIKIMYILCSNILPLIQCGFSSVLHRW